MPRNMSFMHTTERNGSDYPDRYIKFLESAALKWGCSDPAEAARPHEIIETLVYDRGSQIRLFAFNGQYGYCLDIRLKYRSSLYGPFLAFSDPYPTCHLALEAAIDDIIQEAGVWGGPEKPRVIKWARSLLQQKQLPLF